MHLLRSITIANCRLVSATSFPLSDSGRGLKAQTRPTSNASADTRPHRWRTIHIRMGRTNMMTVSQPPPKASKLCLAAPDSTAFGPERESSNSVWLHVNSEPRDFITGRDPAGSYWVPTFFNETLLDTLSRLRKRPIFAANNTISRTTLWRQSARIRLRRPHPRK